MLEQKDNTKIFIATLTSGQIFGEIGLLDTNTKQRTATVIAKTNLDCLEIDKETFADLMDSETVLMILKKNFSNLLT